MRELHAAAVGVDDPDTTHTTVVHDVVGAEPPGNLAREELKARRGRTVP
ncbi:hypothetical protein [Streptomyces sp. NPDC002540]